MVICEAVTDNEMHKTQFRPEVHIMGIPAQ